MLKSPNRQVGNVRWDDPSCWVVLAKPGQRMRPREVLQRLKTLGRNYCYSYFVECMLWLRCWRVRPGRKCIGLRQDKK